MIFKLSFDIIRCGSGAFADGRFSSISPELNDNMGCLPEIQNRIESHFQTQKINVRGAARNHPLLLGVASVLCLIFELFFPFFYLLHKYPEYTANKRFQIR
jgi:hypothetical protein